MPVTPLADYSGLPSSASTHPARNKIFLERLSHVPCAAFINAPLREQQFTILEHLDIPAGAELGIVPQLARLHAAIMLQSPDLPVVRSFHPFRTVLPFETTDDEVPSGDVLKMVDEQEIDHRSASSSNHRYGLRHDLL